MKFLGPAVLLAVALAGCSGPKRIEVQNRGPGPAVVTLRYRQEREVERKVEVPAGGAVIESVWYGAPPSQLEVEAKWDAAVRRQTYLRAGLPSALGEGGSSASIHGLAVSPEGFSWKSPTLWVRLQNPALIPIWLLAVSLGVRYAFGRKRGKR